VHFHNLFIEDKQVSELSQYKLFVRPSCYSLYIESDIKNQQIENLENYMKNRLVGESQKAKKRIKNFLSEFVNHCIATKENAKIYLEHLLIDK
jgi:hypothetical protein